MQITGHRASNCWVRFEDLRTYGQHTGVDKPRNHESSSDASLEVMLNEQALATNYSFVDKMAQTQVRFSIRNSRPALLTRATIPKY